MFIAWQCAKRQRSEYHAEHLTKGHRIAENIADAFSTRPIHEIARLGRTARRWRTTFLAYFTTNRTNNRRKEAIKGANKLLRRARGYRNSHNYRLRTLLAASGVKP